MEKFSYTEEQVRELAKLAAADYAAACTGPTIRGLNGEKHLRGNSVEEVAEKNGISVEEAKALTIDLSKVTFDEMSPHWQNVNIDSAKMMIELLSSFGNVTNSGEEVLLAVLSVPNFDVQAKYAAILHENWLKLPQNSWALGSDLDRPFSELSEEEQAKDVQQLMSLYQWLKSMQ